MARKHVHLEQRGLSVVETTLVLTLLAMLAAIVFPHVTRRIEKGDTPQAVADCHRIAGALALFRADTGFAACGFKGAPTYGWLRGVGTAPHFEHRPEGNAGSLAWFLNENLMGGGLEWHGPYLPDLRPDPWGRHYVVFVKPWWPERDDRRSSLVSARPAQVWVLSAGPDGVLQTRADDLAPVGDDVGVIVE